MASIRFIMVLLLTVANISSFSQAKWALVSFSDNQKKLKCPLTAIDSTSVSSSIENCIKQLHTKGYIATRVDSIVLGKNSLSVFATQGPKYFFQVSNANNFQNKLTNRFSQLNGKPVLPMQLETISKHLTSEFENTGFPFAKVITKSNRIDSAIVHIVPIVELGPKVKWDSIYIKGNVKISQRFMSRYLNFSSQAPFSYTYFQSINKRLIGLPFVLPIRNPELEFFPNKANIYVYLTNAKASRFSGLIGMNSKGDSWTDVQLTGDVNLLLRNAFSHGEEFSLRWNAPGEGSQRLYVSGVWPYIGGSSFAIDTELKMFKQDTSFITFNPRFALKFHSSNWLIGLGVNLKISNLTSNQNLSNINNYKLVLYQVSVKNYLHSLTMFPQTGFFVDANVGIGTQKATVLSNMLQYRGEISLVQPVYADLLLIKIANTTEGIAKWVESDAPTNFSNNELFRIGGSETLRGFNQESILTKQFSIGTIEMHLLVKQLASIYGFVDYGWVSTYTPNRFYNEKPLGLGVGVILNLGEGIINLSYALGKGFGENFEFNNAKVHIGYAIAF